MCYRFWKDSRISMPNSGKDFKRVLILGAGRSGAMLERELRRRGGFHVVGFLDDDKRLPGAQVHGVSVLGAIDRVPKIGADYHADLTIIAMPSASNQEMQRIVGICELSAIDFRTLPTLQDLGSQATNIGELKLVVIDDVYGAALGSTRNASPGKETNLRLSRSASLKGYRIRIDRQCAHQGGR